MEASNKAEFMAESKEYGRLRAAKVRQLLEVSLKKFNMMSIFHVNHVNPNRSNAEKYFHLYNFLNLTFLPEFEALRKDLLEKMKEGEEVVLAENNTVVRKELGELVFEDIKTDLQWQQAILEARKMGE